MDKSIEKLNGPEMLDYLLLKFQGEKLVEKLDEFATSLKKNKLHWYRPYGHPDTLMGGTLWEGMQKGSTYLKFLDSIGEKAAPWDEWSEKPWQLNFHNASMTHQESMVMCANRVGKTNTAAYDDAFHLTGLYPDWYEGKRFNKPVLWWTGSPTNETSRDIVQKALIGTTDKEGKGTGSVPNHLIYGKPKTRQAGVSEVVDMFKVRHVSGGVSSCIMKTYEQGWRKWQGTEPEGVHLDEEPEDNELQGKIYSEALTRLLTSKGIMRVTFTPLLGQTKLVLHFQKGGDGVYLDGATWEDVPHLNREERERLASSYMEHEIEARTAGIPMMGEGAIFKVPESDVTVRPFEIPRHFARIKGIDFGIDHPAGLVDIAIDRDKDIIYVERSWKKDSIDILRHAEIINQRNQWVPVAWPHDGLKRSSIGATAIKKIKDMYVQSGVKMLARSARYDNDVGGAQSQWPIITEIQEREESGRIKYFTTCADLLQERRNYHMKEGKINSIRDDCLKSLFYAVMMRRFAVTQPFHSSYTNAPPEAFSTRR